MLTIVRYIDSDYPDNVDTIVLGKGKAKKANIVELDFMKIMSNKEQLKETISTLDGLLKEFDNEKLKSWYDMFIECLEETDWEQVEEEKANYELYLAELEIKKARSVHVSFGLYSEFGEQFVCKTVKEIVEHYGNIWGFSEMKIKVFSGNKLVDENYMVEAGEALNIVRVTGDKGP